MATIVETIEIDAPVGATRARWNEFLTRMIVGAGRRIGETDDAANWRPAGREAQDGAVEFAMLDSLRTRMTLALDYPDAEAPGEASGGRSIEQLRDQLVSDLHRFREYAERRWREEGGAPGPASSRDAGPPGEAS